MKQQHYHQPALSEGQRQLLVLRAHAMSDRGREALGLGARPPEEPVRCKRCGQPVTYSGNKFAHAS